jgi:hypothetical protein
MRSIKKTRRVAGQSRVMARVLNFFHNSAQAGMATISGRLDAAYAPAMRALGIDHCLVFAVMSFTLSMIPGPDKAR